MRRMKKQRLAIVFAIVLVEMMAFSVVLPLLPYLADEIGASRFQIGLLLAAYPLAQFFGAPILGSLSDRIGRKPVLLLSIVGTGASFVVLALARALPVLFVSRLVDGITGGNISVVQAYISDVTDERARGKALGMIGAAFGIGFVVGPAAGGLLSGISLTAPAWAGAALSAVNFVLVSTLLPESLTAEERRRASGIAWKPFDTTALMRSLRHRRVGPLLGIRSTTAVSNGLFESTFTLWAIAALGVTARVNGLLLGYVGVLTVIVQVALIGRLTKRYSDDSLILASLVLSGASLMAWGFTGSVAALMVLMPAIAVGLGVGNTVMTSALTKAVSRREVGGVLGIQTSVMSLGRVAGPIIGGWLLQRYAVWSPGVLAGGLALVMAPYAWRTLCIRPGSKACDEEDVAARGSLPSE
ncbi:MAG: MFS transporter [Coriobacteriia bacterium]|nr:MFS transporter [Coriobacteriia bacterium]